MRYPIYFSITAAGSTGWAQDSAPPASPGTGTDPQKARTFLVDGSTLFQGAAHISYAYVGPTSTPDAGVDLYQWITDQDLGNGNWVLVNDASPVLFKNGKAIFDFAHFVKGPTSQCYFYVRMRAAASALDGTHQFYIGPCL